MGQSLYRTLIVDDEPQVRELTLRALEQHNFQCDQAGDGNEAMELCNANHYDAVVTDLRMPNRHGHSLVCELLERPNPPKIFVVTGLAEPRLMRELAARGVEDIIHKPVPYELLAIKVLSNFEKSGWKASSTPNTTEDQATSERLKLLKQIEENIADLSDCFEERLCGVFDFDDNLSYPPKAVNEFIDRLEEEEQSAASSDFDQRLNMRSANRVGIHTTAIAVPVNGQFERIGEPFKAQIRDLSEGGCRMLHTRSVAEPYLALCWKADTLPYRSFRVVIRVTRCKSLSRFYDIGGQFVLADA